MQDLLENTNGDILIVNGDFVWGDATAQHQRAILLSRKGDFSLSPSTGIGLKDFLEDDGPDDLNREIRMQFARDGMTVNSIKVAGPNIQIDAHY